jgi:Rieske Fe-S protein
VFLTLAGALVALPVIFGASAGAAGSEHLYPIPAADGVTIDRKTQVIVVRYQQHLYAFNLACPHENTALKWLPKDGRFQCPKHESRYQPSGQFIDGRATRNMDRLGVRVDGGMLIVDVNKFYKSDKDPAAWAAATVAL